MKLSRILLMVLMGASLAAEARMWTSVDGKKVEGDLVKVDGDVVVLLVKGKEFRVPLKKLSEADQKFAKEGVAPAAAKQSGGSASLFGVELVPGKTMEATGDLGPKVQRALSGNRLKPTKMKIKISLPKDFDPTKPQMVFWPVGGINNEKERLKGNVGTFSRGKPALKKGWVVISADTEHGNPRESMVKVCKGDKEFHFQVFEEMTKIWPDFKSWKHACGGHSSGAKGSFFRIAQLSKAKANVVGGYFSGCNQSMAAMASQETKVRKSAFRKVKGFHSTGDKDTLVPESSIKKVTKEMKSGGFKKIQSETFPGAHVASSQHLEKALDWFAEEE